MELNLKCDLKRKPNRNKSLSEFICNFEPLFSVILRGEKYTYHEIYYNKFKAFTQSSGT